MKPQRTGSAAFTAAGSTNRCAARAVRGPAADQGTGPRWCAETGTRRHSRSTPVASCGAAATAPRSPRPVVHPFPWAPPACRAHRGCRTPGAAESVRRAPPLRCGALPQRRPSCCWAGSRTPDRHADAGARNSRPHDRSSRRARAGRCDRPVPHDAAASGRGRVRQTVDASRGLRWCCGERATAPALAVKRGRSSSDGHQPRARHSARWGRSAPRVVSLPWPG